MAKFVKCETFLKRPDSLTDVLFIDHFSVPLTKLLGTRTRLSPSSISVSTILIKGLACGAFYSEWTSVGGLLVLIALILDGTDGKLARMTGSQSKFGKYLDFSIDLGYLPLLASALSVNGHVGLWLGALSAGLAVAALSVHDESLDKLKKRARTTLGGAAYARPTILDVFVFVFIVVPLIGIDWLVDFALVGLATYSGISWAYKLSALSTAR